MNYRLAFVGKISAIALTTFSLALTSKPAQAQAAEALECPQQEVSAPLRALIFKDLAGNASQSESEAVIDQMVEATNRCIARFGITQDQSEEYGHYSFATIAMELSGQELARAGLDLLAVNRIFDVGPDAGNDGNVEFDDERIEQLLTQGIASGTDIGAIPDKVWVMMGVYIAATADHYNYRESF